MLVLREPRGISTFPQNEIFVGAFLTPSNIGLWSGSQTLECFLEKCLFRNMGVMVRPLVNQVECRSGPEDMTTSSRDAPQDENILCLVHHFVGPTSYDAKDSLINGELVSSIGAARLRHWTTSPRSAPRKGSNVISCSSLRGLSLRIYGEMVSTIGAPTCGAKPALTRQNPAKHTCCTLWLVLLGRTTRCASANCS